jgi:hypothetical protein
MVYGQGESVGERQRHAHVEKDCAHTIEVHVVAEESVPQGTVHSMARGRDTDHAVEGRPRKRGVHADNDWEEQIAVCSYGDGV